jgi:hypothetical protein
MNLSVGLIAVMDCDCSYERRLNGRRKKLRRRKGKGGKKVKIKGESKRG